MSPHRRWRSGKRCEPLAWLRGLLRMSSRAWRGSRARTWARFERGEHMPTLALILKISLALKISSAELMTATGAQPLPSGRCVTPDVAQAS